MTTRFAIMYVGTEYNDEGYNIGGDDARILKKTYATEEEAKAAYAGELHEVLKDFNVSDFGEYGDWRLEKRFYLERYGTEYNYDTKWPEYIEWLTAQGIDWVNEAPRNLLQISEIEVD